MGLCNRWRMLWMLLVFVLLAGRLEAAWIVEQVGSYRYQLGERFQLSGDGSVLAFEADGATLVPGEIDNNGVTDVFIYRRSSGVVSRVSVSSTGIEANGPSTLGAISQDGRYVVFTSYADNLVVGDTNNVADVFLRDTVAGTTVRVSVSSGEKEADGGSYAGARGIDASGRFVVFQSEATNLGDPQDTDNDGSCDTGCDTNGGPDVFLRDVTRGDTIPVSVGSNWEQGYYAPGCGSYAGPITPDSNLVVFSSCAENLVPGDSNGKIDLFLRDLYRATTIRIAPAMNGGQPNGDSVAATISDDGRYLLFHSWADNLVANDSNSSRDIFLYDRRLKSTARINVLPDGSQSSFSEFGVLSGDGRYVVFSSPEGGFVTGDDNFSRDVFVKDLLSGSLSRISVSADGSVSSSYRPMVDSSTDGSLLLFRSQQPLLGGEPDDRLFLAAQAMGAYDVGVRLRRMMSVTSSTGSSSLPPYALLYQRIAMGQQRCRRQGPAGL